MNISSLFWTSLWQRSISPRWTQQRHYARFCQNFDSREKHKKSTESSPVLPMGNFKFLRKVLKFCRYTKCNPSIFSNSDTCYVVGFSIILLNTTLHNPNVKSDQRQTEERFIKMNESIEGQEKLGFIIFIKNLEILFHARFCLDTIVQ